MANTMLNNLSQTMNLLQQFKTFKADLLASGKDPKALLNMLLSSGKVSQQQLEQAKQMAELFAKSNNL